MAEEAQKRAWIFPGVITAPFRVMSRRGRIVGLLIAVCCVLLVFFAWRMEYSEEPFFRFFRLAEMSSLNARFLARGPLKPSDDIAIIALDETSMEKIGTYPPPRGIYARLVDMLADAGAKVVVFDILFVEPQNKDELDRLDKLIASWEKIPKAQRTEVAREFIADLKKEREEVDEDGKLAAALGRAMSKDTWVICGMHLISKADKTSRFQGRELSKSEEMLLYNFTYPQKEPGTPEARKEIFDVNPPAEAMGALPVTPEIAEECAGIAYVDFTPDRDGVLRYETLVTRYKDNFYMPMPVMAAWFFLNPDPQQLRVKFADGVRIAGINVPADLKNRMLINYCGGVGTFLTYPLYDVTSGKISPEKFRGKVVFVGATAQGTGDFVVTPFCARLSGVEKHANVTDNILEKRFIRRKFKTVFADIAAIIVLGVAMGLMLPILSPLAGLILTVALEAGWLAFAQLSFARLGAWHNVVYPSLTVFLSFGLITLYRFAVEEKRRREVKRMFERYMDPAVVSDVLEDADKIKLGGDSMAISVFFSDVSGFTAISEKLDSGQLINLLNRYFTPLTDIILKNGGFVNKYQGDAIVAAFGVPHKMPDHAVRACRAAVDCQKKLKELNKEFVAAGLPAMPTRIGLSSGMATVGNIGSAQRLEYTVIGDVINLGQRFEAANKEFGTRIMIGENTFREAREKIAVRSLGLITVVGRNKPVRVYELLDHAGSLSEDLLKLTAIFENGLECFHERRWDDAIEKFHEALAVAQDDGPSKKYLDICRQYKHNPPPDHWDGSVAMAGK